jgi:WXG100 family type VII secretion target
MPEIKMDYDMMAEMKSVLQKGAEDLDDTIHQVAKVAEMLEGGGLIGQGGDAFSDGLRGPLTQKITKMRDKFEELQRDIQNAVESMQQADSDTSGIMGL